MKRREATGVGRRSPIVRAARFPVSLAVELWQVVTGVMLRRRLYYTNTGMDGKYIIWLDPVYDATGY